MTCDRLEREDMLAYLGEAMDPHVDTCPQCRARRGEYQRIAAALAQESPRSLPEGWMEALQSKLIAKSVSSSSPRLPRVDVSLVPPALAPRKPPRGTGGGPGPGALAAVAVSRRTPWLAAGTGVMATAAVMAVILLWPRKPELETRIAKGPVLYRGAEDAHHAGDVLHVKASAGNADRFELRIYLDGRRLVFRCPGESSPDCRIDDDGVIVSYAFPAPGRYEVVWLFSDSVIAESIGSLDADVSAARAAGIATEIREPIDVD